MDDTTPTQRRTADLGNADSKIKAGGTTATSGVAPALPDVTTHLGDAARAPTDG